MTARLCMSTLAVALLAACSTPQIAMDQANNGVKLTQQLQQEIERYQRHTKASAERRLEVVRAQEANALQRARITGFATFIKSKSDIDAPAASSARTIQEAHDKYAALVAEEEKGQQELAQRLAAVAKDLPSPSEKLSAVQKALAALGTELSPKERAAIVTKFLKEAKDIVDRNVKAAEPAASAASPS